MTARRRSIKSTARQKSRLAEVATAGHPNDQTLDRRWQGFLWGWSDMSAYIRCMGCYEDTMDIDSLICSECGYESGMSEIKALSTHIADLESQLAAVTANFERECQDGDRLATALGVPRTEGGSLQVVRMLGVIEALRAGGAK